MSLFGALNSATAGMRLMQANVKVVTDNVTQSDDPNRSRHMMSRSTDAIGRIIAGGYSRQVDVAMRVKLEEATARNGSAAVRSDIMKQVGDILGTSQGEPALSTLTERFAQAWRELETTPESEAAQRQAIQLGDQLAHEIRQISQGVEELDMKLRQDIGDNVEELNKKLDAIYQVNADIVYVSGRGEPIEHLEDRREALVREVAELVDVRTAEREDGRLAVFTNSGLPLVDARPTKLSYDGDRVIIDHDDRVVTGHFREGKIGAMLDLRADGSQIDPPRPSLDRPGSEIIRKLRSQLDGLAAAFTGPTAPGQPTGFADAYNQAATQDGELESGFFNGQNRFTIAIDTALLAGQVEIKQDAIKGVADAVTAVGRSFKAEGLELKSTTYSGIVSGILGTWSAAGKTLSDQANLASETRSLLETRHHSAVGVNLDEEVAHLQVLQTTYAASARVIQAINAMFEALERAI